MKFSCYFSITLWHSEVCVCESCVMSVSGDMLENQISQCSIVSEHLTHIILLCLIKILLCCRHQQNCDVAKGSWSAWPKLQYFSHTLTLAWVINSSGAREILSIYTRSFYMLSLTDQNYLRPKLQWKSFYFLEAFRT